VASDVTRCFGTVGGIGFVEDAADVIAHSLDADE
jgi:hypothetical protein